MAGHEGSFTSTATSIVIEVDGFDAAEKVFLTARFQGENYLKKHFEKVRENGRNVFKYSGRAAVVVSKTTPLVLN